MLGNRREHAAFTVLFLGVVATGAGAGFVGQAPVPQAGTPDPRPIAAKPDDANPKPAPGRMFVVGHVLDPNGKPVAGASIAVYARSLALGRAPYISSRSQIPIGDARSDDSGRFRIDAPRTSSSRHERFGAIALAPGYGVGWVDLDPDDDQPTANIALWVEQVIRGRLFDLQGRPIPGVTLSVTSIGRVPPQAAGGARSRFERVFYGSTRANDFPAWPRPMTSDAEGRFTLRGVGRDLQASLTVHHPRFARQGISVQTDSLSESKSMSAALVPAQIVTGRVTYADTGEGVPHAPLEVLSSHGRAVTLSEFKTDGAGRFRVNPPPADRTVTIVAFPPEGQPYLTASGSIEWPKGALEHSLDVTLPRGVLIRGTVTEEGSGKAVPGATITFLARGRRNAQIAGNVFIETAADGSFRFGVTPSPGCLFIKGPADDYVSQAIGSRMVSEGQPGGGRMYGHAYRLLDLKLGIDSQEVHVVLRRGAKVTGQVVGPDGLPIRDASIFSRVILEPRQYTWSSWATPGRRHGRVRNGRFEIHGLDPDTEVPVYFLEPKRKLGGTVTLSGKSSAGGPVTVRLEPCGAATARVVSPDGKPVAGRLPGRNLTMIVTPGPTYSSAPDQAGLILADEADLSQIDTVNYKSELVSDAEGRISLPALIPGATYRFIDFTMARRGEAGPQVRKEFTVKPGETLDLGDIRIENPRSLVK